MAEMCSLLKAECGAIVCVCLYITFSLSMHLLIDTGLFQILAIVNNAAVNIGALIVF